MPFKMALFWFFFFKEKKCNLEEEEKIGSDPKMGYYSRHDQEVVIF
jgi:hypothetical protein